MKYFSVNKEETPKEKISEKKESGREKMIKIPPAIKNFSIYEPNPKQNKKENLNSISCLYGEKNSS